MDEIKHHKRNKFLGNFYVKFYAGLGVALAILGLFNISQVSSLNDILDERLAEAKEAARPANLQLITILDSNCKECMDITPVIDSIKGSNVEIIKEENIDLNSDKARDLINKYSIGMVPAVLVFGETDKTQLRDLEKINDALVYVANTLPFTDTQLNQVIGRVEAKIIKDSECEKCYDVSDILEQLKQLGVAIYSEEIIEKDSSEGQQLIKDYSVDTLPTLILSDDLSAYGQEIELGWNQIGTREPDGSYVLRNVNPPYVNLTSNKITGLVSLTVLTDNSCEECYDAESFNKPVLQRFGVVLEEEKEIDISGEEGKKLIKNYEINKFPTIIMTGDMSA